ncbi:MAG: glycerophosphodiester phosphodiesterase family protein [Paracoccaceae bacterium]
MAVAISVTRNGHRTFLKWHRARRFGSDPVFTGRRIIEGMTAGASVEVDLVIHGSDGFAVLHDLALDAETTGNGLVRQTRADALRNLHLRGNDRAPIADRVMLLEDLAALIFREGAHPEALLQLDYKEDAAALTPAVIAGFAHTLGPVAQHFVLSSGDADAVRLLSENVPGLRVGYDPCHMGAIARVEASHDFAGFVTEAVAASPDAELMYLDHRLVFAAQDFGFDMIAAFHAAGRRVDAYTLRRADDAGVRAANRLLVLKADQITTDDPEGLAAALA